MDDKEPIRDAIGTDKRTIIPPTKPDRVPKTIVVATTHHRDSDGKVKSLVTRSTRALVSNDDPIIRKIKVNEDWIPLDTAWIKEVGHLHIMNEGGKSFQVVPTEEQRKEAQGRILEIGYLLQPVALPEEKYKPVSRSKRTQFDTVEITAEIYPIALRIVHPGECDITVPTPDYQMYLRSRLGEITVSMMISPV